MDTIRRESVALVGADVAMQNRGEEGLPLRRKEGERTLREHLLFAGHRATPFIISLRSASQRSEGFPVQCTARKNRTPEVSS